MNPPDGEFLAAPEAARRLGVKLTTLYAYASRGLLKSLRGQGGPRRRYLRADIERLRARSLARRGGPPAGAHALHFGEPVLDSAITWLSEEGPVYRGHAATALAARGISFEAVAELLWSGTLPADPPRWTVDDLGLSRAEQRALVPPGTPALALLPALVAALALRDADRFDLEAASVTDRARCVMRRCAAGLALASEPSRLGPALKAPTLAASLATALGLRATPRALGAIDTALILLADHELNASTFAARVAASARADLYSCLLAGLATLAGPRHGGASARVRALIDEIGRPERAAQVLRERMGRGELTPGFGHIVYTESDPRAEPLLALARGLAPRSRTVRTVDALIEAMRRARRPFPNVDTALVSLSAALGLSPAQTPALFAIGRMAGWTAHVLEQHPLPFIVRPRARYADPDL